MAVGHRRSRVNDKLQRIRLFRNDSRNHLLYTIRISGHRPIENSGTFAPPTLTATDGDLYILWIYGFASVPHCLTKPYDIRTQYCYYDKWMLLCWCRTTRYVTSLSHIIICQIVKRHQRSHTGTVHSYTGWFQCRIVKF